MLAREPGPDELEGLRDALDETNAELEHLRDLDRWKDAFLAAAAHDLRAPIGVITGAAETLLAHPDLDPSIVRTLVERVRIQAARLDRLLADLFDLDRFTRGAVEAERRPTDVPALVRRVLATIDDHSHPVEVVTSAPITAELDALRVEQIVDNLVRNAVAHTPDGTPIRVIVSSDGRGVRVTVEDEGPGIPEEIRDRLFAPFVTHPAHADDRLGTGIGLSLVQLFAELHGGGATVEDRPGGGTRFVVELPSDERP